MKIGLMAYHSACNFGATLQLLSTYSYLTSQGHDPIIINWIPDDLEKYYRCCTPQEQFNSQKVVRHQIWKETSLCRNSQEVAEVIKNESIDAVIVGSDAVAQCHPLFERITFPCKRIIAIGKNTSDREFPNPYWGVWQDFLEKPIPMAVMSASCQDSSYKLIPSRIRKEMRKRILSYNYLSVRDTWTRNMMAYLSKNQAVPPVTPDPVFAFNQNAKSLIPTREEILKRYHLPEKYMLLSFLDKSSPSVSQEWIDSFARLAETESVTCVMLPFSHGNSFGFLPHSISLPLSPIDWYALIKYSQGYVGNNMHPIVVSLHNQVPFYSFDTYGTRHLNGLVANSKSSKIKHILDMAGLQDYRTDSLSRHPQVPNPERVFQLVMNFDPTKSEHFATKCLDSYNEMMHQILTAISQ
ncbi:MAG: polysaccharide pyruvyl transferase family protein [Prevotella sp.]|nr:polysaccharide pyruvyl transferase family protein [Prevotella sp.]